MPKMLFIMNPHAGTRKANKVLPDILSVFNRAGYSVTVHMTDGPGDAAAIAATHGAQADVVVCCGGDGTFSETVSGLIKSGADTPIGYIPCGSTNDFAASLHLPTDLLEAATAIAQGTPLAYDAGRVNDQYFSYVASFGAFTRSSYATSQSLKNHLGFLAYFLSGIQELSQLRPIPIKIELEDEIIQGHFLFGAVSNSMRVGRVLSLDHQQVDMSDGKLELMLIRAPRDLAELTACIHQLQNQQYDSHMITFRSVPQLRIHCPEGTVWTLDGERFEPPGVLEFSNAHHAIRLLQKG